MGKRKPPTSHNKTVPLTTAGRAHLESPSGSAGRKSSDRVPRELRIPRKVGDYPIEELLGAGGMGEVFLARDPELGRPVALKRIRTRRAGQAETRARFTLEARITAMLQHPSIIPVYHFSEADSGVFYTMRPIQGTSLSELISRLRVDERERLEEWTVAHLVRIFLQVASAVAFAHSKGVVHRDLKPENVMIGPFEEIMVLDWGVAKVLGEEDGLDAVALPADLRLPGELTTGSRALGTPMYMAPELLRGVPASIESDVFALGVMLYELLALQPPWNADEISKLFEAMQAPPPSPTALQPSRDIPHQLVDVVLRAIDPERERRYHSVNRFSHEVARALEGRATWVPEYWGGRSQGWRLVQGSMDLDQGELFFRSKGRRNVFTYVLDGDFTGNLRVSFEVCLPKGRHYLAVLLNAADPAGGQTRSGYRLTMVAGKSRMLTLFRNGRDVAGATGPEPAPKTWRRVVAERIDQRVSLRIADEEIYAFVDPIPLCGGGIGLVGRSATGLRVRNLTVSSGGVSARVSCLAVPDAFFNRQLYDAAREEYRRIATSLPGRREGREAAFRAGLCVVESARGEPEAELRELLLGEAEETFEELLAIADNTSCLVELGRAIVASERGAHAAERDALFEALTEFPGDPQLPVVREWVLARLHAAGPAGRGVTAELAPLALRFCREGSGERVVRDLIQDVRKSWEMPSFMGSRFQGRASDPVTQAEALLFFGFWSARPEMIVDAVEGLSEKHVLTSRHAADAVFALLELGLHECAESILEMATLVQAGEPDVEAAGRRLEACRISVLAAQGDLDTSTRLFGELAATPTDRVYNGARLALARARFAQGRAGDAVGVLQPRGGNDAFACEHRAWFHLMGGDSDAAEVELKPLLAAGRHRQGRDLTNFLHGAQLLMNRRERQAQRVFSLLPPSPTPRTWTLGSQYAAGRLGDGDVNRYLASAFPWERRHLYAHMALLARVRGDEDEFEVCQELAREPLTGPGGEGSASG